VKTFLTYVALLLIGVGLFWFHKHSEKAAEAEAQATRMSKRVFPHGEDLDFDTLKAAVAEVRLRHPDDDAEVVITRVSDDTDDMKAWRITRPRDLPAEGNAVAGLIRSLVTLELSGEPEQSVIAGVASNELSRFGLDAPVVTVGLRYNDGEAPRMMALGAKDPTEGARYAVIEGTDDVMIVQDRETALARRLFDVRDKRVMAFEPDDVLSLTVADASGETTLRAVRAGLDAPWRLEAPVGDLADGNQITSRLNRLRGARAATYLTEEATAEDIATFGLATPELTVTVTKESGGARDSQRLLVGARETPNWIVMAEGATEIITVAEASLKTATDWNENLVSRVITEFASDELRAITWSSGESVVRLVPETDGWVCDPEPPGWRADAAEEPIARLVGAFESLLATSVVPLDEAQDLAALGLASPEATIALTPADMEREEVVLRVGSSQMRDNREGRHISHTGRNAVFFLGSTPASALLLDLSDLISKPEDSESVGAIASPETISTPASP
jgi:hypothetical protein